MKPYVLQYGKPLVASPGFEYGTCGFLGHFDCSAIVYVRKWFDEFGENVAQYR